MKKKLLKRIEVFLTMSFLIISCSKNIEQLPQDEAPAPAPSEEASVQISLQLPGEKSLRDAQAVLVLEQSGKEKIVKVTLQGENNTMQTGPIVLPAGDYQLTQLKVTDKSGAYVYAVPRVQSARSGEVTTPLAVRVTPANNKPLLNLSATAISNSNAIEFGYPADAFEGQDLFTINMKAIVNVGGYVYDAIDGQLTLTWYDAQNNGYTEQIQLKTGDNEIALAKSATRFVFEYRKWNVTDKMDLPASAVTPGLHISIGGSIAARKLTEEKTWHENSAINQLYSRKTYQYNALDQLIKTMYYQKIPQQQEPQLQQVHEFEYTNGRLAQIRYLNGDYQPYGYIKFTYSNNGLVTHMEQKSYDQVTYAAVEQGIENDNRQVTIDYLYHNGNALEYKYWIENGNKTRESALSSTGGSEGGTFKYDNNINPYYLLGVQDIFLRHNSRNNLIEENKGYGGNIPSSVPYQFNYTYNNAGYPVQLLKKFKGYSSGEHLYTAKTIYTYKG